MRDLGLVFLFVAFCLGLFSQELTTEINKRFDTMEAKK